MRCAKYSTDMVCGIDVRRMWREVAVEGTRHPIWSLVENHADTMFHDEVGKLYCKYRKPAKFGRCGITDGRENALRRSFTFQCHAAVRGVPSVRSAIDSVAFAKMQNGVSHVSSSTRTSFAPLRRCAAAHLSMEAVTQEMLCTGAHQCPDRS